MDATSTTPRSCAAMASRIEALAATSKKDRAVISGGAGFIGSHLCEALLARDLRVLALDNFITGSRDHGGAPPRESRLRVPSGQRQRTRRRGRRRALRAPLRVARLAASI